MASNRFSVLPNDDSESEIDSQSELETTSQSEPETTSATDFFHQKHLGDVKVGWSSFINLLLTFIVSGEKLVESDKVIDKLATPILGDVFEQSLPSTTASQSALIVSARCSSHSSSSQRSLSRFTIQLIP